MKREDWDRGEMVSKLLSSLTNHIRFDSWPSRFTQMIWQIVVIDSSINNKDGVNCVSRFQTSHNNILWLNLLGFVQQGCLKNSLDFSLLPNSLTNHIQDIKMSSNLIAVNAVNSSSVNEQDKRLVNSALYNLTLLPKLFACIYKQNIWQTQLQ